MRKTLLITGASTGIGAATAQMAAARGYDLVLNYRSNHDAAAAVAQAATKAGARVVLCAGDVANPDDIDALYAKVDAEFGRLDGLVNNAGIVDTTAKVTDFTHARLRQMFDVNVIGAFLVAKEAVLRMQAQGDGGAIVNVSSAAARLGSANLFAGMPVDKNPYRG
jgi:NAD(P)-dependent dehydrogenase (short-subunit alcohol dehydrogenase family)